MARLCSIRTWFAATLVAVSLLTAAAIALYVVPTTDDQYRDLAQDAALGVTARAARDVGDATARPRASTERLHAHRVTASSRSGSSTSAAG